jgi:hypothetical protein
MKQRCKRRDFLGRVSLGALSVAALGACSGRETPQTGTDPTPGGGEPLPGSGDSDLQERTFNAELDKNRTMPRDLVNKMLDQKVDEYMQRSHHCAQSAFMALKEQFALDGEQVFRALTPLPGIAERGETCGAVTGPLMALGLIYGRDIRQMDDWTVTRHPCCLPVTSAISLNRSSGPPSVMRCRKANLAGATG